MNRLRHAGLFRSLPYFRAGAVIDAVCNHGPAIIHPRAHHIQLVPTLGAMLMAPEKPGAGLQRQALHVAVAVGVDFRSGPGSGHEGIVRWRRTVGVDADQRTDVVGQILGWSPFPPVPQGDEQRAIAGEREARAKMPEVAQPLGPGDEDDFHID